MHRRGRRVVAYADTARAMAAMVALVCLLGSGLCVGGHAALEGPVVFEAPADAFGSARL